MRPMTRRSALKTLLVGAALNSRLAPALALTDQGITKTRSGTPSASTTSNPPVTVIGALSDGTKINLTANPGERVFDSAGCSVKHYNDGAVCVENAAASVAGDAVFSSLTVTLGASNVLWNGPLTIWRRSRTAPFWYIQPKAGTLDASKVPKYGNQNSSASFAAELAKPKNSQTAYANYSKGPMGSQLFAQNMDMTGERPDIGILPGWDAAYVINPSTDNLNVVKVMGDAAAVWPYHFLDPKTGKMLSLTDYPHATLDAGQSDSTNPINLDGTSNTPLQVGTDSHFPAMAVLAALVFGSEYYVEEAEMAALYAGALWEGWGYRLDKGAGPCSFEHGQTRGKAWRLRQAAQASVLGGPNASMFADWVNQMISEMQGIFSTQIGMPVDQTYGGIAYPHGGVATWQEDFLFSSLVYVNKLGFTAAKPLALLMAPFFEQRLLFAHWIFASIYYFSVRKDDGTLIANFGDSLKWMASNPTYNYDGPTGQMIANALAQVPGSAAEMKALSFRTQPAGTFLGYPTEVTGYSAIMQPAVYALRTIGSPNAQAALKVFQDHQTIAWVSDNDQKYNIVG